MARKNKDLSMFFAGMGVVAIVILGTLFIMNGGTFLAGTPTEPTIPDQQVKISFKIIDSSSFDPVTSDVSAYIYTLENGLYVRQDTVTPDANGLVTSTGYYTYGQDVYVQVRSAAVGGSMTYYTTPLQKFTVTFSASVDQGSTVFINTISVKKITSAVTASFANQAGNDVSSGNFSTSDSAIRITLGGLTDNTYYGGDDFVDYYYTPARTYLGGVFVVIKSSVAQPLDLSDPHFFTQFSDSSYNYYVFRFDQIHDDSSSVALETYQINCLSGQTLAAASTFTIDVYDYVWQPAGGITTTSYFSSQVSITGYDGMVS